MSVNIKYVNLELPITKRKYDINKDELVHFLRSRKKTKGLSNRDISEFVERPITEVEHWFRTDMCSSIPDKEIWYKLKSVLGISTEYWDDRVTIFEEVPGVFEKAGRFYDVDGIAPTLTSTSAAESIIISDEVVEGECILSKNDVRRSESEIIPFNYVSLFSGI